MEKITFFYWVIIYIVSMVFVKYLFKGLFAGLTDEKDEIKSDLMANKIIRSVQGLGTFIWILFMLKETGMSEMIFTTFTGVGTGIFFLYIFSWIKTNHMDAYIQALAGKHYKEGHYLKLYNKNGNVAIEGEFYSLSIRNMLMKPYRETSLVQIPTPSLVGQDGYIIKDMDFGNVGMFEFDVIVNLEANLVKIKDIIFGVFKENTYILNKPAPFIKPIYMNGHYILKFTYYCKKDKNYDSAYIKAKDVWNGMAILIIEKLRAVGIKIGLSESLWWNGTYDGSRAHMDPGKVSERLKDQNAMNFTLQDGQDTEEKNGTG